MPHDLASPAPVLSRAAPRLRFRGLGALLVVLVAVAAAAWWWMQRGDAAPAFRTTKIERGPITAVVSSSGSLSAVTTVVVGSQVSGQIKELLVDFNSAVKKNDLLARIDPESFQLKVKQVEADLESARTNLINQQSNLLALRSQVLRARIQANDAKADYERKESLLNKNFISAADRDKAKFNFDALNEAVRTAEAQVGAGEAQVANAQAQVKQREAALASARVDLERTDIRAPVDGVVISRAVDAGQTVAASLNAPTLFTIAQDLRRMQVEAAIDESDISRIQPGQAATFTVDAFPGRTFRGDVAQIRKAAVTVQNVVTYTVVIATANPDLQLVPGMTANVRVVTDARDNVLKVPNAALRYRPPGTAAAKDADAATASSASAGRGNAGDVQARRQKLAQELKLDAAQQARLDEIFADQRSRVTELRDLAEPERRTRMERLRVDMRQKINAMLAPDQQKLYAEIVAAETGRSSGTAGRVYTVGGDGKPVEVRVRLGLTDGTATEVVGGDLGEGAEVIVGAVDRNTPSGPPRGGTGPRLPF